MQSHSNIHLHTPSRAHTHASANAHTPTVTHTQLVPPPVSQLRQWQVLDVFLHLPWDLHPCSASSAMKMFLKTRQDQGGRRQSLEREGQGLATLMCLTIGPRGDQHSHWPISLSLAHCIIVQQAATAQSGQGWHRGGTGTVAVQTEQVPDPAWAVIAHFSEETSDQ